MEMVVTKSKKLLSIITVTKNNHDELKRTIESITGFLDYCSVELIVVNGGEKFRDQDNIFKNFNENDNIKILHGHDSGIYNAMNKGLRKSKGKYIWILNSGDEYAHEVQEQSVMSFLQKNYDILVFAHKNKVDGHSKLPRKLSKLNLAIYLTGIFNHQSIIFERNSMKYFIEKYTLRAEYESYYQMLSKTTDIFYINRALSIFYLGGLGQSNKKQSVWEYINIMWSNKNFYLLLSIPILLFIVIK